LSETSTLSSLIYATQGALAGPNFASDILGTFFFRTFFGYQLQPADPFMGSAVAGIMLLTMRRDLVMHPFAKLQNSFCHSLAP